MMRLLPLFFREVLSSSISFLWVSSLCNECFVFYKKTLAFIDTRIFWALDSRAKKSHCFFLKPKDDTRTGEYLKTNRWLNGCANRPDEERGSHILSENYLTSTGMTIICCIIYNL